MQQRTFGEEAAGRDQSQVAKPSLVKGISHSFNRDHIKTLMRPNLRYEERYFKRNLRYGR